MTQKTIAEQIADAQNVLVALSKQVEIQKVSVTKQVESITITFNDGTNQKFVPEVQVDKTPELLSQLRVRADKMKYPLAGDPLVPSIYSPRKGFGCIIEGKKYNSIMHAARALDMCRHTVKHNLDSGFTGWDYE